MIFSLSLSIARAENHQHNKNIILMRRIIPREYLINALIVANYYCNFK